MQLVFSSIVLQKNINSAGNVRDGFQTGFPAVLCNQPHRQLAAITRSEKTMASTIADGFHATRPAAVRRDHGVLPARVADESSGPQRFVFTGTGSEYFRIWVVNLLLTILTFGVFSAWAKVRRLQY